MPTYELRITGRDVSNIKWYLQEVDGTGQRYPTSGTITASSQANSSGSTLNSNSVNYSAIHTEWTNGGGISTDLSGLMTISSGYGLTIKVVNDNVDDVYNSGNIESIIVYYSAGKKKKNVRQGLDPPGYTGPTFNMGPFDSPYFIMTDDNLITDPSFTQPFQRVQMHISAVCVPPFTKIPKIVEIKDVSRGDIIRTSRGDLPIAHIMKTQAGEHKEYVKFEKGCLAPNLPSDNFYVTEPHPLSLGFYKNEVLNNGKYDDKEDDYIMLQMAAGELVDRLPGITKVKRDFGHYYNLVFDEHASIDMEGIDVCSHHPRTGPFFLPRDKYVESFKIDENKIEKKITNPKFIRFDDLIIRHKPEDVDLKEFLASCLTSNLNEKRQLMN